jgi:protein-disulfide isomerase
MKKISSVLLMAILAISLNACEKTESPAPVSESSQYENNAMDSGSTASSVMEKTNTTGTPGILTNDDPVWGDENAAVTMVVFSDFQCPYCGEFFLTLESLGRDWIDTGKLKIQHRDFPLTMHLNSMPAHIAANAAARQGKYMEMHRLLFEHQKEWETSSSHEKLFLAYAEQLGLDTDQFRSDLGDADIAAEIQADKEDGKALGVSGTPGFFINNVFYEGALSYEQIVQILDEKK